LGIFSRSIFFNLWKNILIKQRYPFLIFIIFWKIHCFSFETSVLYDAIEEQNPLKIIAFFDNVDSISFEESKELLLDIYHHFTDKFGIEVFDNQEYQNLLIKYTHLYLSVSYGFYRSNLKEGHFYKT
jgi:hypothetical protein